jgi:hypothetical protein
VNILDKMANRLNEDLKRFNSLMGYNPSKGIISERMTPNREAYYGEQLNEAEPGEEEETTDENPDFDFGDEGNPEDAAAPAEGGDEEEAPAEEGGDMEGDEFGTADEFSAADELDDEESDVEEIDVTDIIKKSDEASEFAKQALTVGQENGQFLKSLTDKLSNLETQLSKMDSIASKITKLEQDIKTPEEKLELRSLDSYPFNMKLTDYWEEKAAKDKNYRISGGETTVDGEEKEYVITPEMIDDLNPTDIKASFVPESYNRKKKVLKEGEKEQTDAKSRIEAILTKLSPEDRAVVVKSMSRPEVTRKEVLKNFKK